ELYWERIQLHVKGKIENISLENYTFSFRTLTDEFHFSPTGIKLEGNTFDLRFNIAILNDGNYLPSGDYLLSLYNSETADEIVAQPAAELYKFPEDEDLLEELYEAKTENEKNNVLLAGLRKEFKRGGANLKYTYKVTPMISADVNEFVFSVSFTIPVPKPTKWQVFKNKIKEMYHTFSFNFRTGLFKSIFYTSQALVPKNGKRILFSSDSRAEIGGNFEFVLNKMKEMGIDKDYKIKMTFKPNIRLRRAFIEKFRFPFLLGSSDIIFIDDYHPMIYTIDFSEKTQVIQLWHACGAFKTVGFSRSGKQGGPFFDDRAHRNYTRAIVASDTDIPFYAEAFGIKESSILPTGVPRTDIFFDPEYKRNIVTTMEQLFPETQGKQVILFAPTFRGNGANQAHYPYFKINLAKFAEYCRKNNSVVIFKMHPFIKNEFIIPEQYADVFIDASSYREVNDILFITDILITDYSSVIFEFSTLQRKMLFYAFDLEDYVSTRDFYEEYEGFVPGKIVYDFEALIKALEMNDFEQEKVKPFLDKHFKYQDTNSAKRIVEEIFKK
ncbi:CDP-glycerol glycerophosphotransferase family protein, partial [Listeria monocytogenes]|nr:CDP-glycerol glycerophosphotransferase family protein [Listeria monocytogenes]